MDIVNWIYICNMLYVNIWTAIYVMNDHVILIKQQSLLVTKHLAVKHYIKNDKWFLTIFNDVDNTILFWKFYTV